MPDINFEVQLDKKQRSALVEVILNTVGFDQKIQTKEQLKKENDILLKAVLTTFSLLSGAQVYEGIKNNRPVKSIAAGVGSCLITMTLVYGFKRCFNLINFNKNDVFKVKNQ